MTVVPPTDRPKSVCNHFAIQVLVAFMYCQLSGVFLFSCGIGFLSYNGDILLVLSGSFERASLVE